MPFLLCSFLLTPIQLKTNSNIQIGLENFNQTNTQLQTVLFLLLYFLSLRKASGEVWVLINASQSREQPSESLHCSKHTHPIGFFIRKPKWKHSRPNHHKSCRPIEHLQEERQLVNWGDHGENRDRINKPPTSGWTHSWLYSPPTWTTTRNRNVWACPSASSR